MKHAVFVKLGDGNVFGQKFVMLHIKYFQTLVQSTKKFSTRPVAKYLIYHHKKITSKYYSAAQHKCIEIHFLLHTYAYCLTTYTLINNTH